MVTNPNKRNLSSEPENEDQPLKKQMINEPAPEDDIAMILPTEMTVMDQMYEQRLQEEELPANRYMLLDKLFHFIRSDFDHEDGLNPVLSGYFSKVLKVLITKR